MPDVGEGLTEAEILTWHVAPGDTVAVNQILVEIETAKAAVELPSPWAGHGRRAAGGARARRSQVGRADHRDRDGRGAGGGHGGAGRAGRRPRRGGDRGDGARREDRRGGRGRPDRHPGRLRPAARVGDPPAPPRPGRRAAGRPPPTAAAGRATRRQSSRSRVPRPPTSSRSRPRHRRDDAPARGPPALRRRWPSRRSASSPGTSGVDLRTRHRHRARRRDHPRGRRGVRRPPRAAPSRPPPARRPPAASAASRSAGSARPPPRPWWPARSPPRTSPSSWPSTSPRRWSCATGCAPRREYADVRLTPLAFVAKAVCLAARRTPEVNARWDEAAGEIVYYDRVQLGIAAATPRGLIVPKIRDADTLSLRELADRPRRAHRHRPGRQDAARPTWSAAPSRSPTSACSGSTPARRSSTRARRRSWPSARSSRRPGWSTASWPCAPSCQLALSFDHRLVDGEQGSRFLADVGALLTDPGLALTW